MKGVPPALDRIADVVLAYRPAAKQKRKNVSRRRKTKSKGRK